MFQSGRANKMIGTYGTAKSNRFNTMKNKINPNGYVSITNKKMDSTQPNKLTRSPSEPIKVDKYQDLGNAQKEPHSSVPNTMQSVDPMQRKILNSMRQRNVAMKMKEKELNYKCDRLH